MEDKEIDELREHYEWSYDTALEWGLSPFPVDFHVVPADKMYEIASYGIPGHFSHWTYGRDYWRQKTTYDYGLSKIYELIINSNPSQAFLLETNSTFENMFVISHCMGHSDFFARNAYFENTYRRFDQTVALFANRIHDFETEHGRFVVEELIDKILTISHHVESNSRIQERDKDYVYAEESDPYEDLFPEREEVSEAKRREWKNTLRHRSFPVEPTSDLMGWIAKYGDLQDWEREIVWMIREESLYFQPQMKTKIMNEGWASIIHRCMMHAADLESDTGGFSFAHLHSRVFSNTPGALNPYVLGYNIFWDVIQKFGDHSDKEMDGFDFIGGPGWEKALEIVEIDNDATFVSNYLSEFVCEKMDLFEYGFDPKEEHWIIEQKDWEKVRDSLVNSLFDARVPQISVVQGAPNRRLELRNMSEKDLNNNYAKNTLSAIGDLWGIAGVVLGTVEDESEIEYICSYEDGKKLTKKKI